MHRDFENVLKNKTQKQLNVYIQSSMCNIDCTYFYNFYVKIKNTFLFIFQQKSLSKASKILVAQIHHAYILDTSRSK